MWHFVDLKCHKLIKKYNTSCFQVVFIDIKFFQKIYEKIAVFQAQNCYFQAQNCIFCTHLAHKSTSQARFVKYMNNLLFFSAISPKILNYYVFDLFIIFVCMSFVVQAVGRVNKYLDHLFIHLFIQNCLFCNPEFG